VNAAQAAGYDFLGGSVCCFNPGEYVDVYQGSVTTSMYLNTYGPADSSGKITFQAASNTLGLQLVKAYPLGTTDFVAVGEDSGKQFTSNSVQVVIKVNLTSATWTSGEVIDVSGFAPGSVGTVHEVSSGGATTTIGSVTVGSEGRGNTAIPRPAAAGTYQIYVTIAGTNYPSPPATMTL
jgi:hypothetical protein